MAVDTDVRPDDAPAPAPAGQGRRVRRPWWSRPLQPSWWKGLSAGLLQRVGDVRARRASRPPRPPVTGTAAALSASLTMIGLVCLWLVVQLLGLSALRHDRDQALLYQQFRTEVASATAPVGPVTDPGEPVALLRIPSLGIEEVVVEGTASGDMLAGPGHQRNTVLPGQEGTSVIMGRSSTYGRPFAALAQLRPGDTFQVVVAQGTKTFTVLDVRGTGDPLPAARTAGTARVVLATATTDGRLGALSPGDAVYVDAEAKNAFAAPAGLPSALPDSEQLMGTEADVVLPLLTACLAGLVGLALLLIAARQRWSAALVWTVASPVVLALAWVTTDVVVRLLPNVI
ncbi:sortase [Nocardioides sp. GY 10127]|uniref:sortase domain-containing protein n=1 Tax=Nocardioides sp. GY 10127 TaxID=2569762 RepID=UPI0010A89BB9|nr:sortase [Nocardioides sp. GY 10127]TIC84362.1 sortase [Nocardioides sp. GY 10127]